MNQTDFAKEVPPAEAIRNRLATLASEQLLLRDLLKIAIRRERASERLARMSGGASNASR